MTLTLELDAATQSFHVTMMHHKTKFGWKRFSSSVDTVETHFDCTSPHCDRNHEDGKPVFLKELWLWMIHYWLHFFFFFLYSTVQRCWADSQHSHVILHEWIAFHSAFLNIHRSGVLTALAWLVPHESAAVSARSVYTIQPCTISLHAKPHT